MKLHNITFAALALLALAACNDKMEYAEYNVYDQAYVQKMFGRVGGFMTRIYNNLDSDFGNYGGAMLSSATDESVYSHEGNATEDFFNGKWGPTNDQSKIWASAMEGISYCNLVLDEFSGLKFPDYALDKDYKAELHQYENYQYEARWARAYFYFELVRQYGTAPLKTRHMTADEANALPLSSADDIFQFIDDECDAIQNSIIVNYGDLGDMAYGVSETGRAGKLAVMALRARAALYHASPLFNPQGDKALWNKAVALNQAVLDEAEAEKKGLTSIAKLANLFQSDSWKDADAQKEFIFGRRTAASNSFEKYNFPIGMERAQGGNCPTQNLVDAYETKAGLAIADDPSYDPQNPYANRDKRLALTVAVNGEKWPNSNKNELEMFDGGANSAAVQYGTPTGYYLKKYCNPATIIAKKDENSFYHIWITFRLGEFYLNYAEAALNATGDAYTVPQGGVMTAAAALNKIRNRAGQPKVADGLSFADFKAKYENERFVELAFEGHRFYDVRRWKAGQQYFNTDIRGMQITKNPDDGTLTFAPKTVRRYQWQDKYYFFPFPEQDALRCGYQQPAGW